MINKDIIGCNGFGFMGVGGQSLSVWLLIPLLFSPFSPGSLYDRKKLSQISPDGTYSCLQGVVCAHLKGSYVFNEVM